MSSYVYHDEFNEISNKVDVQINEAQCKIVHEDHEISSTVTQKKFTEGSKIEKILTFLLKYNAKKITRQISQGIHDTKMQLISDSQLVLSLPSSLYPRHSDVL
ncbi:hypothetical protein LOAG_01997 [Loa loa]|uniref:Uncharacterized protein n=1 Tax=Loa loa TaxID=7209 RepID=A0A1S0U9M3_LOALO|nr:hypothetical protein LOAG_01997 [Loa loa]EFO26481.1 hypothetical protein LOAG_01997 [Loa loa]